MRCELTVHLPGAAPERRALTAPAQAGGSRADAIHVPGLAPGALRLVPTASGLVVEAAVAGVRVAGHAVAPGARRLLRGGESADVQGVSIALERGAAAPGDGSTRVAAAALLRDAAAGEAAIAGPRLVVLTGPTAGERHPLGATQTLGRGRAAAIRIPDPQASRVHARVLLGPDGVTVEDLRSKNGVRVNGVRLDRRPCRVAPGEEISIGETALAVEDPWAAAPGPGPARARRVEPAGTPGAPPVARRVPARVAAAALLALTAAALALAGS